MLETIIGNYLCEIVCTVLGKVLNDTDISEFGSLYCAHIRELQHDFTKYLVFWLLAQSWECGSLPRQTSIAPEHVRCRDTGGCVEVSKNSPSLHAYRNLNMI
jgi:hypothetical protein